MTPPKGTTAVESWLEDAVKGEWVPKDINFTGKSLSWKLQAVKKVRYVERFLLDPAAWQAVGKVRGWKEFEGGYEDYCVGCLYRWHRFIDSLAQGKDIEAALGGN